MNGLLDLMRRVVEQELAQSRGCLLGVVSTVFPHTAAGDDNNYEVNVKLKHEELELRQVPVAVGHMGMAAPPRVGDLVLVQFINGDLNQPVITGRFYHAGERPPLHQEGELLFEHRVADGTLNQLRFAANGSIFLQRDVTRPDDNSEAGTSVSIDGASGDIAIQVGAGIKVEVKSDRVMITGNVEIRGDLIVTNGSNSTIISGNTIEGG